MNLAFPEDSAWAETNIDSAWKTHVGCVRETNEDNGACEAPVYLVADGMGGHAAGEIASAYAVEEFLKLVGRTELTSDDLLETLKNACARVREIKKEESESSAGTTIAAAFQTTVDGEAGWLFMNLGDSRIYRIDGNGFAQISTDHSLVQELLDAGELTPEMAKVHPYRHMITRALGAGARNEPDIWFEPLQIGERLLICSDGLSGEVPDAIIESQMRISANAAHCVETLVEQALQNGGRDNVTVMCVFTSEK